VQSVDHFWLSYVLELLPFISISHYKLSEALFKPSQHKSAANIRICTAIRILLNPGTPEENQFVVMSTLLDHQSDLARRFGASLMLHYARQEAAKFGPVLVFGDFNRYAVSSSLMECIALMRCSPPTGSDSGAYAIMTGQRAPAAVPADFAERYPLKDNHSSVQLHDLRGRAPRDRVSGGLATYTDWRSASDPGKWARIDFIFGSGLGGRDHWFVLAQSLGRATRSDVRLGRFMNMRLTWLWTTVACWRVTIGLSLRMSLCGCMSR
jgi:endonuclease/exonuclease/phosphatase family metal-dependent hydrolase